MTTFFKCNVSEAGDSSIIPLCGILSESQFPYERMEIIKEKRVSQKGTLLFLG
jgi:hypothetical protein